MTTISIFIIIPFKYALLTKCEVNATGYIWPNSCFCILLDFPKVLYFFPGRLCHETSSLGRCATSCIEARLRSLLRTYERSTCSKSSILFTETKSRQMKKERHQYPVILTEQAWSKRVYLFYGQVTVVFIQNGLSCCYLVSYE